MMNYGDDMEVIKDKKYMRIQGEELAKKTGINQSDLSKIERGTLNPSVKMLKKLLKA